jgi:hypothetical protein
MRGASSVRLSALMSGIVRIYRSQLLLTVMTTRLTRRRSSGAVGWGSQPGVTQVREEEIMQLIPLDDDRGDEDRTRTARAR